MAKYGKAAANSVRKLANASTLEQYNSLMTALQGISPIAHADLDKIPKEQWVVPSSPAEIRACHLEHREGDKLIAPQDPNVAADEALIEGNPEDQRIVCRAA